MRDLDAVISLAAVFQVVVIRHERNPALGIPSAELIFAVFQIFTQITLYRAEGYKQSAVRQILRLVSFAV